MSTVSPERRPEFRREDEVHRVDEISDAVRLRLLELVDQGAELIQLGDADDVAAQLVSRLPIANPWPEIVGPCYTSGSLQRELGVSRAALSKAVSDGRLLRLMTSDGQYVYPAFQVVDGALVRGLREVLAVLRTRPHILALGAHIHAGEKIAFEINGVKTRFEQSPAVVGPSQHGPLTFPSGFTLYTVRKGVVDAGRFVPLS